MHHLGFTRSARRADYILQTPDAFVRGPLPVLQKGMAIVHAAPAIGARFTQYTVEFQAGGSLAPVSHLQRFVFVLEGNVTIDRAASDIDGTTLGPAAFAYFPTGHGALVSPAASRIVVVEKPYEVVFTGEEPRAFVGVEDNAASALLNDDPGLQVRSLIPDEPGFDFRMNTMTYLPGAALPMVEVHVMEHGLLMLAGGGIYRLSDDWCPVEAGDFIYMAPYCPQWFGALGKAPAKYLLYKDWARHPQ